MAIINDRFIQSVLASLAINRPVFHSEADFQHEFAWKFRHKVKGQIRLEKPFNLPAEKNPAEVDAMHVDILIRPGTSADWIAFELKYTTKKWQGDFNDEQFNLKDHSAHDVRRYDFWRDVRRLERLRNEKKIARGYAIIITNHQGYWNPGHKENPVDKHFRLHSGRGKVKGKLSWLPHASEGTIRGRKAPINLCGKYTLNWESYSEVDGQKFRYLLLEV